MTVHAHPDDESSKGAATVAKYHAQGVRTVLVTCTGGEEGDILNPALDLPEIRANLAARRRAELDEAARVIGYDEVVMLGYRDSGMPGSPANADPRSFASADLSEAVGRLVAQVRRFKPQVLVTYPKDQSGYPHPDHLRVNEICELAFDASGDPEAYPEAGPAWQVSRMFYVTWSAARIKAMHDKFLELGLESPFSEERFERMRTAAEAESASGLPKVVVDVSGFSSVTRRALLAHATQVDPSSRYWFGLPEPVADSVYPYEEYQLARDLTGVGELDGDLFGGLGGALPARVGARES